MLIAALLLIVFMAGTFAGGAIAAGIVGRRGQSARSAPATPPIGLNRRAYHNLQTPLRMIAGYCDLWLNAAKNRSAELPMTARDDFARILHNTRQMQTLIEQIFTAGVETPADHDGPSPASDQAATVNPPVDHPTPETDQQIGRAPETSAIAVLNPDRLVAEWLRRHLPGIPIRWAPTLAEFADRLSDQPPIGLMVTSKPVTDLSDLIALTDGQIPILSGVLPGTVEANRLARRIHYLGKPITYETLAATLASLAAPVQSILIIDDHQDSVAMLDRLLIEIDPTYRVWKAYSGREGLSLLHEQAPDVVILDLYLPDLTGLTIARLMQIDPRLANTPILLASAQRALDASADIMLPMQLSLISLNGFAPNELTGLLEHLLGTRAH